MPLKVNIDHEANEKVGELLQRYSSSNFFVLIKNPS